MAFRAVTRGMCFAAATTDPLAKAILATDTWDSWDKPKPDNRVIGKGLLATDAGDMENGYLPQMSTDTR